MKTAKGFVVRLNKDEAFAKEVNEKIRAKKDAGGTSCAMRTPSYVTSAVYSAVAISAQAASSSC